MLLVFLSLNFNHRFQLGYNTLSNQLITSKEDNNIIDIQRRLHSTVRKDKNIKIVSTL